MPMNISWNEFPADFWVADAAVCHLCTKIHINTYAYNTGLPQFPRRVMQGYPPGSDDEAAGSKSRGKCVLMPLHLEQTETLHTTARDRMLPESVLSAGGSKATLTQGRKS